MSFDPDDFFKPVKIRVGKNTYVPFKTIVADMEDESLYPKTTEPSRKASNSAKKVRTNYRTAFVSVVLLIVIFPVMFVMAYRGSSAVIVMDFKGVDEPTPTPPPVPTPIEVAPGIYAGTANSTIRFESVSYILLEENIEDKDDFYAFVTSMVLGWEKPTVNYSGVSQVFRSRGDHINIQGANYRREEPDKYVLRIIAVVSYEVANIKYYVPAFSDDSILLQRGATKVSVGNTLTYTMSGTWKLELDVEIIKLSWIASVPYLLSRSI